MLRTTCIGTLPYKANKCPAPSPEIAVDASASPISDHIGGVTGAIIVVHDVTRSRLLAKRLAHLATHDPLAGHPNRVLFSDRQQQALSAAARRQSQFAVFLVDMDDFKDINDRFGHLVGDQVLKEIVARLPHCVRASDTVSRYGGDATEAQALLQVADAAMCSAKHVGTIGAPPENQS